MQITTAQYKKLATKCHKYNAKQTIIDGIKFPSKKEAEWYTKLKFLKKDEHLKYFLRQVPFHLPGNVKYLTDFMTVYFDGSIEFIDVKGRDTPMSKLKRKQVLDLYGVEIKLV